MPENTRRHERHEYGEPVYAKCATWGEFLEVYARNISHGGLFVRTDDLPEVGSPIELRVQTPDKKMFTLSGRVAHVIDRQQATVNALPVGFGVEFVEVTSEQAETLARLIAIAKRHEAAPPPPRRR
jgi:uncharacterized protein (TIGR02266 family)